ncbi:MAG: coproporphyrinogen III oxidase, partial [Dehalococcoidia bacterium]|nr:coproporphyrinogen III oxidase [Dehalococcoidia bacterium]
MKCGYCDFNAYAGLDGLKRSYRDALLAEIAGRRNDLSRHTVTSIAFGGGTPGEQPAEDLIAVIDAIRDCTGIASDAEISIEV